MPNRGALTLRATTSTPQALPVSAQRRDDRRTFANIGERLDRLAERLGDQRLAGAKHRPAGRPFHRNTLAQYLIRISANSSRHHERVHLVGGLISILRKKARWPALPR